uniref:Adaptor protein complex 4 subunit mu n=1 Tax=Isochrysis galbana TaxID=37099 RepID=A0A0M4IZF1_ISOGA|nr:adaptor protein complex 4 subunit mu [Isochrysis galbana]
MISQLFILAPNGHTIVNKDYRGDVPKDSAEIFLRKLVEKSGGEAPIFNVDGVNYMCVRKSGLFFLATTLHNVPPAYVIELLTQLTKVCKDYIGVLNEESLRKNFTLIYELVDEIMDFGYPQSASTAELQAFVFNEPAPVSTPGTTTSRILSNALKSAPKTMSSKAVQKPIALRDDRRSEKNEIFVDVIDRISATFNAMGQVRTFSIDGSIQMKSYLSGSPELHLALNDDLAIASAGKGGYGMVELDNVNFHECVQLDKFDSERMLVLEPPHGEFVLMNFHIGSLRSDTQIPFRITPIMTAVTEYKQELRLQVDATFPEKYHGANVKVHFTVPKSSTGASVELEPGAKGQSSSYDDSTKQITWTIRKFMGTTSHTVSCKFVVGAGSNPRKEMGPISMNFEIPMYNVSRLQVQHLKIVERNKSYNPHRWVRCLTHADSYVCRI